MSSISELRQSAMTTRANVLKKFEAVRALDGNALLDTDGRRCQVRVAVDDWVSTCSFSNDGSPVAFQWKSSKANQHAEKQADAPVTEHTYGIETEKGLTKYSYEYYGPNPYGEFDQNSQVIAVFDTASGDLVDCRDSAH